MSKRIWGYKGKPLPARSEWSKRCQDGQHKQEFHYHEVKPGFVVRCYHKCRGILTNWQFWAGLTLGFPVEHFLYERVPPFVQIARLLGLH